MEDIKPEKEILENVDQPIGEKVLGTINPKTLIREEFESSPELLFHGSSRPFIFSRDFDYHDPEYLGIDEGTSVTLGMGFYTTDRGNATDYSHVRASFSERETNPHVTAVLPYQARCLDLRSGLDPSRNAPLPQELIDKWIEFYRASTQNPDRYKGLPIARHLERMDEEYLNWLSDLNERKIRDLKMLLRTNEYPGPPWTYTFSDFMIHQGFDGLVYNEGSEKNRDQSVTTYVFYNLDKIGTYETWHQEREVEK